MYFSVSLFSHSSLTISYLAKFLLSQSPIDKLGNGRSSLKFSNKILSEWHLNALRVHSGVFLQHTGDIQQCFMMPQSHLHTCCREL